MANRVVAEALAAQAAQEARLEAAAYAQASAAVAGLPLTDESNGIDEAKFQQQEAPTDGTLRPSTSISTDSIGKLANAGLACTAPELRRPLLQPLPHGRTIAAAATTASTGSSSALDESNDTGNGSRSHAVVSQSALQVPEAWAHTNSELAPETAPEEESPMARHDNLTNDNAGKLVTNRSGSMDQNELHPERWAEPSNYRNGFDTSATDDWPAMNPASSAPLPKNLPLLSTPTPPTPLSSSLRSMGGAVNDNDGPRLLLGTAQSSDRIQTERASSAAGKPQLLLGRSGGLILDGSIKSSSRSRRGDSRATPYRQALEQEIFTAGRVAAAEVGWTYSEAAAGKLEDAIAAAVDEQRRARANVALSVSAGPAVMSPPTAAEAAEVTVTTTKLPEQGSLEAASDTTVATAARVLGATFVAEAAAAAAAASEEAEEAAVAAAAKDQDKLLGRQTPAQRAQSHSRKKRLRLNDRVLSPGPRLLEPRAAQLQPQQKQRDARQPLPEVRPPPRGNNSNNHYSNSHSSHGNYCPSAVVDAGAEALAEARAAVVALRPSQAAVLAAARTHVQKKNSASSGGGGNNRSAMGSKGALGGGRRGRGGGAEKLARDEHLEAAAQTLALKWAQAWTGPRLKALVARVSEGVDFKEKLFFVHTLKVTEVQVKLIKPSGHFSPLLLSTHLSSSQVSRRKEAQAFQALKWAVAWHATCNAVRAFQRCRAARGCGLVFVRLLERHCLALFRRWQLTVEQMGLAEAHAAAARGPQALGRSFLARCRLKQRAKDAAACEMQRLLARGPQGRSKARAQAVWCHRKAAAVCIERCYTVRLRLRRQRQAARAKKILNAVNALQGFLRSGLDRAERRLAAIEIERYQAATKIQSRQRQRAAMTRVQNIRRARRMHAAVLKVCIEFFKNIFF